mgnify:CR=1 FL=1
MGVKIILEEDIIGIDFGTSNSKMAFMELDTPTIIRNKEDMINTPSVIYFKEEGDIIVGEQAKKNLISYPQRTIYSIKRKMGSTFRFKLNGMSYPPEYLGALIIRKLIQDAKETTGHQFNRAVVSVPANYTDGQRQSIKDAAEIAGLTVIQMINEPTAAALAYGINEMEDKRLLVYDFGGGTFDVTVLTVSQGFFDVEACSGINQLGGNDIDKRISEVIMKKIRKIYKINPNKNLSTVSRIREIAENVKIQLSTDTKVEIKVPFIGTDSKGLPINFEMEFSREKLEELIRDLIYKTKKPLQEVLDAAHLSPEDLDEIILVGGTTKIPAVQDFVEQFFKKRPNKAIDPYEAVALGAAIAGASGKPIKSRNKIKSIEISDVLPHSLGIFAIPEGVSKILPKNIKIPIKRTKLYSNLVDYTPLLMIEVFQGESSIPMESNRLGKFFIEVEPKPAGENQLDVTFEITKEFGILQVTARDRDSKNQRTVRLEAKGRLSKKEKNIWRQKLLGTRFTTVYFFNEKNNSEISISANPNATIANLLQELHKLQFLQRNKKFQLFHNNTPLQKNIQLKNLGTTDTLEIHVRET